MSMDRAITEQLCALGSFGTQGSASCYAVGGRSVANDQLYQKLFCTLPSHPTSQGQYSERWLQPASPTGAATT